ncbi:MAG: nuclear transport factor 2 family protein [Actinobacteria bacterium]|nr:nuclear transport factor 2 family protein [Actinomycetota bacterium]
MRRFVLAAFALTVLAACQPASTELTEEMKAEIAAEVNALQPDYLDAWSEADFERGMAYWVQSPDVAYANQGVMTAGYANMFSTFGPVIQSVASQEFEITDRHTVVLASDVVCVVTQGTTTITDLDGVATTGPPGVSFTTWVRRDGEWKVYLLNESNSPITVPETP